MNIFTKPEKIFYEDVKSNLKFEFEEQALICFVEKLDLLINQMDLFDADYNDRERIKFFYKKNFAEFSEVDFLTFYESYHKELKSPANALFEEVPEVVSRNLKIKEWANGLVKNLNIHPNDQTVNVKLSHLTETNKILTARHAKKSSYGALVHFFTETDSGSGQILKGVVSGVMEGYGKMISRFLDLFDKSITDELKLWNSELMDPYSIFVENMDGSFYNGNTHPPIMPYEISIPGGHNILEQERRISIADLKLRCSGNDDLQLIHKPDGKQVYVFDMGFQWLNIRSESFKLLKRFSLGKPLTYGSLNGIINQHVNKNPANDKLGYELYPRIVYEDIVILQRRAWLFKNESLPKKSKGISDFSYFLTVNKWRQSYGLPNEVFIRIDPFRKKRVVHDDSFAAIGDDDYKPQYINFSSPALTALFEKLINKKPEMIRIEEILPEVNDLMVINNKKYVTEFLVQWHSAASGK